MSVLTVLDHTGDTRLEWDASRPDEVAAARASYDKLKAKSYLAYRVTASGEREVIRQFDPAAENIVMTPQLAGG